MFSILYARYLAMLSRNRPTSMNHRRSRRALIFKRIFKTRHKRKLLQIRQSKLLQSKSVSIPKQPHTPQHTRRRRRKITRVPLERVKVA